MWHRRKGSKGYWKKHRWQTLQPFDAGLPWLSICNKRSVREVQQSEAQQSEVRWHLEASDPDSSLSFCVSRPGLPRQNNRSLRDFIAVYFLRALGARTSQVPADLASGEGSTPGL